MSRGSSQLKSNQHLLGEPDSFTVEPPGKPLDRCTQSDTPYSLTAVGVVSITLPGVLPSCQPLVSGEPPFQVLRTWSPGFICEGTTLSSVFSVGAGVVP